VLCNRSCLRARAATCAAAEQLTRLAGRTNGSGDGVWFGGGAGSSGWFSATGALAVAEARRAAKAAKVTARIEDKARIGAERITSATTNTTKSISSSSSSGSSSRSSRSSSSSNGNGNNFTSLAATLPSPDAAAAAVAALHWPAEPFTLHLVDWRGCDRSLPPPESVAALTDAVDDAAAAAAAAVDGESAAVPGESAPLLWLGPDSTSGQWRSALASGPAVARAVAGLRLQRWPPLLRPAVAGSSSGACPADLLARQFRACAVFSADGDQDDANDDDGGTATGGGSSGSSAASWSVAVSQAVAASRMRCAPVVFLAGASKSASTWLFNALAMHPQVKSTPLHARSRARCFSFSGGPCLGESLNLKHRLIHPNCA